MSKANRARAIRAKKNIGILHYAGRYKAWEFYRVDAFNGYYYDLLAKSAFNDAPMPQLSKQNVGRNFKKELIRIHIADFIASL